jgi:crotonobetainyl-CoA:carnitine CoA-transferase CaiB-like acyl-CoA transferase
MIFERMQENTLLEWREIYRRNPDCAGKIMHTTQEARYREQFVASGHVVELDDPQFGRMKQLGPFAKLSATPAAIKRSASLAAQHTANVLASFPAPLPAYN